MENIPTESRDDPDDMEFAAALKYYRSVDIGTALSCENPIVRMFAVLDRRIGKRTLQKLCSEAAVQPEWLQFYHKLRLTAENTEKLVG